MGNSFAEKAAFRASWRWYQPTQDPPGVLCATTTGRLVGPELTEWLDQGQIAEAKGLRPSRDSIRKAIRPAVLSIATGVLVDALAATRCSESIFLSYTSSRDRRFVAARPGGSDEFDLLVLYDLASAYNSPVETLTFKFADAARAGADFIGDDPRAFDRIVAIHTEISWELVGGEHFRVVRYTTAIDHEAPS